MTGATTVTTVPPDNIHRTPKLDAMGLARCRKDNELSSLAQGRVMQGLRRLRRGRADRIRCQAEAPSARRPRAPAQPAAKERTLSSRRRQGAEQVSEPSPCLPWFVVTDAGVLVAGGIVVGKPSAAA